MTEATVDRAISAALADIAPEIDFDTLDRAADLQSEADLDSMDFLNLLAALAEALGIEVPERDYPQVRSIDGLVTYLSARQPA
ncbi:MAG: phosphopantetheine-binding protein [Acidimicrobiia bacterium]|nr:phosphopantetheine-binding protein [Acidimicrobiia bacterium]